VTVQDAGDEGAALAEHRRALARTRDKALQNLLITHEYVSTGRRSQADVAAARAGAEAACGAVAAFDARHPFVRTTANAEDDAEVMRFMDRMTGY
jgi:hypothetical protein